MSSHRHRAPRGVRLAADAGAPGRAPGRHRAGSHRTAPRVQPQVGRASTGKALVGTAAAIAALATTITVLERSADDGVARVTQAALGGPEASAGRFRPASIEQVDSAGSAAGRQARAARDRARDLLADRVAQIERTAAELARTRLEARQRACGYDPRIQRAVATTSAQRRNARVIIDVGARMGLPPRAAVIAVATALQESYLRNIAYGHLDSEGLFQQRPSAGWGGPAQINDPDYAARAFYRRLVAVFGWQGLPLTVAAQQVQASAHPRAYAKWERVAAQLVAAGLNADPDALTCTPR